jgi:hypothetical protein
LQRALIAATAGLYLLRLFIHVGFEGGNEGVFGMMTLVLFWSSLAALVVITGVRWIRGRRAFEI